MMNAHSVEIPFGEDLMPLMGVSRHAVTQVKCVTRVITRDFLRFEKTDFHFIFIFQSQVTRVTLTVSASSERRNNAALSLQNHDL